MGKTTEKEIGMVKEQQPYEISDAVWEALKPQLPRSRGEEAEVRRFVNGVFWMLRTGRPWRDLPPCYGKWGAVYKRFREWREKGVWERVLAILVDHPDFSWLIVEVGCRKIRSRPANGRKGGQKRSWDQKGNGRRLSLPWVKMVCRSEYLSQRVPELIEEQLAI